MKDIDFENIRVRLHKDYDYDGDVFFGENVPVESLQQFHFRQITKLLTEWSETEDHDFIDSAIVHADNINLPIKGVFLEVVTYVARLRLTRDEETIGQLTKKNKHIQLAINHLLHIKIYNLMLLGWGFELSCELVAAWALRDGKSTKKASTLKKEHGDWIFNNPDYVSELGDIGDSVKGGNYKNGDYLKRLGYDLNDPLLIKTKGVRR